MPKNTVTDPITDQEMAFAHLILSGTMTDRSAAAAVGLNPDTAAYTKAKPRVCAYMLEHRAAVREKLVDQEAQGLRKLNFGRDQILTRLWELAHLSPEATRGSIAGQIKAMSMIVAIEGLIPGRHRSPSGAQPAAPPLNPDLAEWLREEQHQTAGAKPADPLATGEAQPASPHAPAPEPPPLHRMFQPIQPGVVKPSTIPSLLSRVPAAAGYAFDDFLCQAGLRPPISPEKAFSRR
jgi:hypothetical protein